MFTVLLDLLLRPFTKTHTILKDIGSGSFGTVLLTRNKVNNKLYVAKFIKTRKIKDHVPDLESPHGEGLPLEIHILSHLNHPNIVSYVDCVRLPQHWVFTMDYLENYIDLKTFIRMHGRLSEQVARTILTQTYDALVYCLSSGVDHRDVKHQNILVDQSSLQTKLIDFGLSSICNSKTIYTSVQGTELFLPPEALVQRRYTPLEGTTWSLGCLLYCMVSGRAPFSSKRDVVFLEPHLSSSLSPLCVDLIKQTLHKVRHLRIRFEGVRWHAWMNLDRIRQFLQNNSHLVKSSPRHQRTRSETPHLYQTRGGQPEFGSRALISPGIDSPTIFSPTSYSLNSSQNTRNCVPSIYMNNNFPIHDSNEKCPGTFTQNQIQTQQQHHIL